MEHFTSLAYVIKSVFSDSEEINDEYLLELFGKVYFHIRVLFILLFHQLTRIESTKWKSSQSR